MQCIIARAANRKHTVFTRHTLTYEEIEAPQQQLQWLIEKNWFNSPMQAPLNELSSALTKAELIQCLKESSHETGLASVKKADLQRLFAQHIEVIRQHQCLQDSHVYCGFFTHIRYLLFFILWPG
jgi:hypothetical protein